MEDELPAYPPPPPPNQNGNVEMVEQNENSPTGRNNFSRLLKLKGNSGGGDGNRRPFRQTGLANSGTLSSSIPSSLSSAERNCRKKSFLQKQKSTSALGEGKVRGKRIKCVLIGDSKIGKSALVRNFINGQSTPNYVPTTEDIHVYHKSGDTSEEKNVKGQEKKNDEDVVLQICDTGGQEDMDRLRPLCYTQAQVVIICFSVMNPASFTNVTLKWLPEVKRHCMVTEDPENPLKLLLVGTQSDLRSNVNMLLKLMDDGLAPISETQALRLASKIGALKYVESSAIAGNNVNHIFDLVMKYGLGKVLPKQLMGLEMNTSLQGKILPNLTERKLLFWRKWRVRQNKSSNKMKRLVLLPCLF